MRRLNETDVVEGFDCGDEDLNDNKAGCRFITVDAYASAIPFYLNYGFSPLSKQDEDSETRLLYFDLEKI
ncbi:MAG: hypothetical protein KBT29_07390 [Prevotellaceae bacterium]|nr:hypothetical protein [Candidatus Minthosoma caballi]